MTRRQTTSGRRTWKRTIPGALAIACFVVPSACSDEPQTLGYGFVPDAGGPVLVTPDDGAVSESGFEPRAYCPSDKCPPGYTTCPDSRFPCDVDVRTDRSNCGACGSRCLSDIGTDDVFECIQGRCALQCDKMIALDCDGIVDNGCETPADSTENCGECGNVCSDPARPCVRQGLGAGYACGCPSGQLTCVGPWGSYCVEYPKTDNFNCGRCGNECDPDGPGKPAYSHAYYGCDDGECGALKCGPDYANCDGDLENGCETFIGTRDNCGACGNDCAANQDCRRDQLTSRYKCLCPAGQIFCQEGCADINTDPNNCGSCGVQCHDDPTRFAYGVCNFGTCSFRCVEGRADCNGNPDDSCEVNTYSDPINCGGCGIVCDAIAGQACVRGQCVVEPCEQPDAEPVPR